jgi:hypothetical protein
MVRKAQRIQPLAREGQSKHPPKVLIACDRVSLDELEIDRVRGHTISYQR